MQYRSFVAPLAMYAVQGFVVFSLVANAQTASMGKDPVKITAVGKNLILGLGDTLTLNVPWEGITDATHNAKDLVLFLDGRMLKKVHPFSIVDSATEPGVKKVAFDLVRDPADADAWKALLGRPDMAFTKTWNASIGYEDLGQKSTTAPFGFMIIRAWAFWASIGVIALGIIFLVRLARTTDMLRDPNGYFSLGRTQMAIWFVLVIAAFVFIWAITADYNITIPASILGLIGISAGTGLAAQLIDTSKDNTSNQQLVALQTEESSLTARLNELEANLIPNENDPAKKALLVQEQAEKNTRLAQIKAAIVALVPKPPTPVARAPAPPQVPADPAAPPPANPPQASGLIGLLRSPLGPAPARSFFHDILSDGTSISFHRFQIFAWTIILAIVFVDAVYNQLALPIFSDTLLSLMGVSAGTYIGFKFPEKG